MFHMWAGALGRRPSRPTTELPPIDRRQLRPEVSISHWELENLQSSEWDLNNTADNAPSPAALLIGFSRWRRRCFRFAACRKDCQVQVGAFIDLCLEAFILLEMDLGISQSEAAHHCSLLSMMIVWEPITAAFRFHIQVLSIVLKGPVCKINKMYKEPFLTDHLIFRALQVNFLRKCHPTF